MIITEQRLLMMGFEFDKELSELPEHKNKETVVFSLHFAPINADSNEDVKLKMTIFRGSIISQDKKIETDKFIVGLDDGYVIAHLKSVHQLQNLYFALTGEELIYRAQNEPPTRVEQENSFGDGARQCNHKV